MNFIYILFGILLSSPAQATTTAKSAANILDTACEISGLFLGEDVRPVNYRRKNRPAQLRKVFWNLEVRQRSASDAAICPQEKNIAIRIRGADARPRPGGWTLDYPVHVTAPAPQAEASLRIFFVSGRDSLTRETYSEWVFREFTPE